MIDVSNTLIRSCEPTLHPTWDEGQASVVALTLLAQQSCLVTDWDRAAGESWIRLLDDDAVVFLVSTKLALVLTLSGRFRLPADLAPKLELLEAASLDRPDFTCSAAVLDTAFPGASASPALDVDRFSLMDLWYATV